MTRSLKRSAWLLLLFGMASVALLTLVRGSAVAQSGGETASISARGNELWSATMRVSNHRGLFGYSTYSQRTFGDLSSDEFNWRGTTHTVNNILYDPTGGNSEAWDVVADFSPALPDDIGRLTLRLGNRWLNSGECARKRSPVLLVRHRSGLAKRSQRASELARVPTGVRAALD